MFSSNQVPKISSKRLNRFSIVSLYFEQLAIATSIGIKLTNKSPERLFGVMFPLYWYFNYSLLCHIGFMLILKTDSFSINPTAKHSLHFTLISLPVPWQFWHSSCMISGPILKITEPLPQQDQHLCSLEPGSDLLPRHLLHLILCL